MKVNWLANSLKLIGTLLASLLLNLPIHVYRNGRSGVVFLGFVIAIPFGSVAALEFFRQAGRFQKFLANRSFDWLLVRTFICSLPSVLTNILAAVSPGLYSGGLQYGMLIGLLTVAPYSTLDRPHTTDLRYWMKNGLVFSATVGSTIYLVRGRSTAALVEGLAAAFAYLGGLWLGLMLGNNVNKWGAALRPTFQLLRRMGRALTAFAVGYLAIVVIFSTLFAAVWRFEGAQSFAGLPASPTLPTFIYFSLITATTVGYGDIVPKSMLARSLAGSESIVSLAWTLVVFAALAVRFAAEEVRSEPPKRDAPQ